MPHVLPPYRADVVGSFLRPAAVAQARAAFARGELSREALTAVEDEEIAALVKKELDNGLTAVTDGEFRRAFWHLDFLAGLKGIRHVKAEAWSVHFEGRQPKAETVVIEDRLSFPADHPFLEAFDRLKKIAGDAAVKYTIPSPSMLHLICCVRATDYEPIAAYKDNEELLLDDLAQTWTDAMLALYERGCRYLQLDDTSWGEFCSAEKRAAYAARGIDVDAVARSYVGVLNRIIAAKPADLTLTMHICRGNFRSTWFSSGGYEPIAEILFANCPVDGFFLEYDSERSGGFEPLRFIKDQTVVLGLITSKFPELEDKEAVKELFGTVADKVANRPGGYCRILKLGYRLGDGAEMAMIELVDFNENMLKESPKAGAKRTRRRRTAKKADAAPAAEAPAQEAPAAEAPAEAEAPKAE